MEKTIWTNSLKWCEERKNRIHTEKWFSYQDHIHTIVNGSVFYYGACTWHFPLRFVCRPFAISRADLTIFHRHTAFNYAWNRFSRVIFNFLKAKRCLREKRCHNRLFCVCKQRRFIISLTVLRLFHPEMRIYQLEHKYN